MNKARSTRKLPMVLKVTIVIKSGWLKARFAMPPSFFISLNAYSVDVGEFVIFRVKIGKDK